MAANDGFLRDEDGESPDWIEIHNPSTTAANVGGWRLTDNASNPAKWTFPDTSIPPHGYLVVFASGKNRAVAGRELHTNFQLATEGEYLALIQPDGVIAHQYAPQYPPLRANVSYGLPGGGGTGALQVDFNDRAADTAGNTEPGFHTITLNSNPATFNGMTVTISPLGGATLDDRNRPVPLPTETLTQHRLYKDFIFASGSIDGYGMRIHISGLQPDADYRLTLWSVDAGGSSQGNRITDWIETASGTTNVLINGYVWNVNDPPSKDGDNTITALVRSSSAGELQIEGRRNGGVSTGVYVNGLRLDDGHEPEYDPAAARFFTPATPGFGNGPGYAGIVAEPEFSVARGFYDAPFAVALSVPTPGAEIRWTTNGAAPTATTGTVYVEPIPVSGTTLLRAAAFLPDHIPSLSVTHSYIFLDEVLQQPADPPGYPMVWQAAYPADYEMDPNVVNHPNYGPTLKDDLRAIPTLSIVAPHETFWHPSTGIYVDARRSGIAWERSASAELFNGDGTSEFQINCGVRMQGNASRDNNRLAKHSFRLLFKSAHGPSKLRHDWFSGGADRFDNIVLRACFTDAWPTRYSDQSLIPGGKGTRYRPEDSLYLRDIWVKDSMADMGHLSGRGAHVHLYVNGLYWGLYNPTERLDASFFSAHLGGYASDWDVVRDFTELLDGSMADWNEMMALVNAGIASESAYQAVAERVDIDNLIDYMLLHIYAEAEDWPHHNWYAAHRRANATNGLPATKWIFLPWDQEIVLDQLVQRNLVNVSHNNTPARIYSQLRAWPEFRRLFGDRLHKHLFHGGALTPGKNIARMQARVSRVDRAIVGESARWGDAREFAIGPNPGHGQTFTRDEWWVPELDKLYTNYFQTLNDINIARFRAANLYPNIAAPEFRPFGGPVPPGFGVRMAHTNATGTIYYTADGSDPREYGTGAIAPSAQPYAASVPVQVTTLIRARVLSSGEWSALVEATFHVEQDLSKLAVTEIMYNPPPLGAISGNNLEFLELKNVGNQVLHLWDLSFTGIAFTFTNGTLLEPGEFLLLARDADAFAIKYPGVPVHGVYTGQLDNSGERITLSTASGETVFSIRYDDEAPWPVTPDGHGFSLVPGNPNLTPVSDRAELWRASAFPGGSPGADDPEPGIPAILVNEVLAHTDLPQSDAVELFNPTGVDVDIGGWFLTDNPGVPKKFRIPDGTVLPADGYVYFDESDFNSGAPGNINFAFSSLGESAYVFSGNPSGELTGYSHGFAFGPSFNGDSFGRYVTSVGEEHFPWQSSVTLGQPNPGPRVGPVVINEIHYHPAGDDTDEFIELFNISDAPVPLFHPVHPTNTWILSGVSYTFPQGITMGPTELLLVAGSDPEAFRAKYDVPDGVRILGPFPGRLDNSGDRLRLRAPDSPNLGVAPYVTIDEVAYGNQSPWPPEAAGSGASLQRASALAYANDPVNWIASLPTPGRLHEFADSDGDGLPDWWEIAHGTNWRVPDADEDPDGDGMTNRDEFLAGTDPNDPESSLRLRVHFTAGGQVTLQFLAIAGRTYSVLYKDSLLEPDWSTLVDVEATGTDRMETVMDSNGIVANRFYRLVTPGQQ